MESVLNGSYMWTIMGPTLARSLAVLLVLWSEQFAAAEAIGEPTPSSAQTPPGPASAAPAPSSAPSIWPSPSAAPSPSPLPSTPPTPAPTTTTAATPAPSTAPPPPPPPPYIAPVPSAEPTPSGLSPTQPMFAPPRSTYGVTSSSVSLATPPPPASFHPQAPVSVYVSPFQLRNVSPRNGIRIDTVVAPYRYADMSALETVVLISGQLRLHQHFFLQAKWGFDDNRVGNGDRNRTGIVNPSLGVTVPFPIGSSFRFSASTAVNVPLATGGGDGNDVDGLFLQRQGALARSAMENNAFVPNNLGFPTGLSLAFVHRGFTGQVDGTVIPAGRVKGTGSENDVASVNSTFGLFLGYLIVTEFSVGAELRYQYFLLPPAFVEQDPSARDNLSVGAGARLHLEVTDSTYVRPGICVSTGLAGHVESESFRMVQFDIPITF